MNSRSVNFLGLSFDQDSCINWVSFLTKLDPERRFCYIVTPNVDHVVSYHEDQFPREIYDDASYRICDSRILSLLARIRGKRLNVCPGSDIVRDLLQSPQAKHIRIAIFGPLREDYDTLVHLFPRLTFEYIDAPLGLQRGSEAWNASLEALMASPFDLLLCCIGFPKQEYICHDLKRGGRKRGIAICCGASLDFLTGRQSRAPLTLQRLHLEWLYRLATNPCRLWRRYLVQGPKIIGIMLRVR